MTRGPNFGRRYVWATDRADQGGKLENKTEKKKPENVLSKILNESKKLHNSISTLNTKTTIKILTSLKICAFDNGVFPNFSVKIKKKKNIFAVFFKE